MVERSPEKAGVGGSIPSLATIFSSTYVAHKNRFCSILFQNQNLARWSLPQNQSGLGSLTTAVAWDSSVMRTLPAVTTIEGDLLPIPTFKQVLDALKKQVLVGRTYLDTAKGLLKADPVLLQTGQTFFGMTIDGDLNSPRWQ